VGVRINRSELVVAAAVGEITAPLLNVGLYDVGFEGEARILPSVGGINPNVRIGDGAFDFAADHIEPGASIRHADERFNAALNALACVGNEAIVLTGEAKGECGRVTGTHGGIEHVMLDFPGKVLRQLAIGDRIQVWCQGMGMKLLDAPDVKIFNADPDFVDAWKLDVKDGFVRARVAKVVPAAVMGSGLGRATVVRGDYDIQTFDDATAQQYGLRELRLGDLVAIVNADHSFGRIYRTGAISVGVVVHGRSFIAGHGPGVTSLLTSPDGKIEPVLDEDANLAKILKLR
jgi:hypothetical protein